MKKIIVWGCGGFANRFLDKYEKYMRKEYEIIAFSGNDEREEFRGIPFVKPDRIEQLCYDEILVLSSFYYEIKKRIQSEYNIPASKIIDRSDVFCCLGEALREDTDIPKVEYDLFATEAYKFAFEGEFINRSKGHDKLLIVLAGYKQFMYDAFFERLEKYLDSDIDVCIITSGKVDTQTAEICEKNDWSYLSSSRNNVSLVQNVAIKNHPNAEYIYKLDEDILITKNYFQSLFRAYEDSEEGMYEPSFIAPLIPINFYGFIPIIEKLGIKPLFEERFSELKYKPKTVLGDVVMKNSDFAKFMWGENGFVPSIDELNDMFSAQTVSEYPCTVRFNTGAILFSRKTWYRMGYFRVDSSTGMGEDEKQINEFCITSSQPLLVSHNTVVGHFSFGPQTEEMKNYYFEHPEMFRLK